MTHIASYIQALAFAVLFLIYIGGSVGWALIYILVGMAVFSVAVTLVSRKRFSVSLSDMAGTAECGEHIVFGVNARKNGFCLLPYIEIEAQTESGAVRLRTSLIFGKTADVTASFRAAHGGLNRVTLTRAFVSDFFGFIRLEVKLSGGGAVAVFPKYIDYAGPDIAPKTLPSDDDENEGAALAFSGGFPGYDHREYAAGDSPRRVNYKLSAKRGKLMVRLDEPASCAAVSILIDSAAEPSCGDAAFALARRICERGGTARISFRGESYTAASAETIGLLREWLAFRDYGGEPPKQGENAVYDVAIGGAGEITAAEA
ncbi:MAG: DUF58 domain-containing protein [Oscillospiraceae bacterium]